MRHRSPVAAYVAILAIALQALWPLLAQAKPKNVVLVPVCTVQGVTHYIELPSGNGAPIEQHAASQHDHCSFCSFGGDRAALASFLSPVVSARIEETAPRHIAVSELRSEKPYSARPRAPPAVS